MIFKGGVYMKYDVKQIKHYIKEVETDRQNNRTRGMDISQYERYMNRNNLIYWGKYVCIRQRQGLLPIYQVNLRHRLNNFHIVLLKK